MQTSYEQNKNLHVYIPHIVYKNLEIFIKQRNLELVSGYQEYKKRGEFIKPYKEFLKEDEFIKMIQYYGFVQLEAKDLPNKVRHVSQLPVRTFIFILDIDSKFNNTQEFTKLIERLPDIKSYKHNYDIIFISETELSTHIKKKIKLLITEYKNYIKIHNYKYSIFTSNLLQHEIISPHKILDKESEAKILQDINITNKSSLPKIFRYDPVIIWIGAEVGDIIEIKEISESVGENIKYRVVV